MFLLNRGELEARIDPYYYKQEFLLLADRLEKLPIDFQKLRFLSNKIFSGITPLSKGDDYVEANIGIPFVRSGDFTEHNQIDFDSLIYLSREIHEKEMRASQLKYGDLLIAIVGATIGKVGVYSYEREANINQAVCGVRLKPNFNPFFVQTFLFTSIGQKLLDRLKRPVARANINLEEIGTLLIPILDLEKQQEIVDYISKAYAEKKAKEAEAREKLASVDNLVLDALGITLPEQAENTLEKRIFFTKSSDISSGRFDPDALHPERISAIKAVQSSKYRVESLRSVAKFVRVLTTENLSNLRYVGLDNIQSNTGIYIAKSEVEEFGTANVFESGQILFPKLRPYLNKVFYATFNGVCSTEFFVLDGLQVSNRYLACFLRTSLIVSQTKRLMTGNTLPRLQTKDVESLQIPIPPPEVQTEIAERVEAIYSEAKKLRADGKDILEKAKREVEAMILGESPRFC